MNTEIPKATSQSRASGGGYVLAGVLLALAGFLADATKGTEPVAMGSTPASSVQAFDNAEDYGRPQKVGWDLADELLTQRHKFEVHVGTNGLTEWPLFTEDYFRNLMARRDSVRQWAETVQPEIFFVGQMHLSLDGSNTPDRVRKVDEVQHQIFEILRNNAHHSTVIAFEQDGCHDNEVVTPVVYVRLSKDIAKSVMGVDLPRAAFAKMMWEDTQAATRAILKLPEIPVICGEEWPFRLDARFYQMSDPEQQKKSGPLVALLDRLRSEIIVIRTLEFLQSKGGTRGTIIQGVAHLPDVVSLAPAYHLVLTTYSPI